MGFSGSNTVAAGESPLEETTILYWKAKSAYVRPKAGTVGALKLSLYLVFKIDE